MPLASSPLSSQLGAAAATVLCPLRHPPSPSKCWEEETVAQGQGAPPSSRSLPGSPHVSGATERSVGSAHRPGPITMIRLPPTSCPPQTQLAEMDAFHYANMNTSHILFEQLQTNCHKIYHHFKCRCGPDSRINHSASLAEQRAGPCQAPFLPRQESVKTVRPSPPLPVKNTQCKRLMSQRAVTALAVGR